ncbi:Cation:proton antiporter [Sulfidibacter corallicola]|uniref:Cation:proton antiporter n=1 Tax=Sulfidibacter corallicola TaxID=2818388 RepID=A0A8A4TU27_SULCO|nr:cation:proton antiporter [Sulfidibacter corallicola]QTD52542.1 cation:proton antiporter [Sulfidibacter corallicola]
MLIPRSTTRFGAERLRPSVGFWILALVASIGTACFPLAEIETPAATSSVSAPYGAATLFSDRANIESESVPHERAAAADEPLETGQEPHQGDHGITHQMMVLVLQLAFIVIAARIGGELFERYLKQPAVLGELCAGMVIGPYALGPYLTVIGGDPLFPLLVGQSLPVSAALYGVATIASIVLLFLVGLETDFPQFVRYAGPGAAVGIGGVLGSFITGDLCYVLYAGVSFMDPAALFMGAVSTATSVGITARVLSEKKKLDAPEGTTILAGAVIDDVLGILILAVVGGIAEAHGAAQGEVDWTHISWIAVKAFGFWIVATAIGIALSKRVVASITWFKAPQAATTLSFGLALLLAGIAETFGLAMIIGAYIMGLSLSKEPISHYLERSLTPVSACLVPVFFAVMGMLVNFEAMGGALLFGIVYSVVAVFSKVLGSGIPCFLVGFNALGASRIGLGMLPRGEVALIVAGVGLSAGYIGDDMFGVVIMMTLITTLMAPPGLVALFAHEGEGLAQPKDLRVEEAPKGKREKLIYIDGLTWANHDLLIQSLRQAFEDKGFFFRTVRKEAGIYQMSGSYEGERVVVAMRDTKTRLEFKTDAACHELVKAMVETAHVDAQHRISRLRVVEVDLDEVRPAP